MLGTSQSEPPQREALAALPQHRLVAIIEDLARTVEGVGPRLDALMAMATPSASIPLVRRRIAALHSERTHLWGHKGAQLLAAEYDAVLDVIEQGVLPSAPIDALALIAAVIETDERAFERADDSDGDIGAVFRRAVEVFGLAAKRCASAEVLPLLQRLQANNHYGARDGLVRQTAAGLSEAARAELITAWRSQLHSGKRETSRRAQIDLQEMADAIGDPVLYEEAALHDPGLGSAVARIRVAERYLTAGRPEDALARLPATGHECGRYSYDWEETRINILRALGQTSDLREALWEKFTGSADESVMRAWLRTSAPSEHAAMIARARSEVLEQRHSPADQARYFLSLQDPKTAAACILDRLAECRGDDYETLVPLAKSLASTHPVAASALYRKLLESLLKKALSKYYHHAAGYWNTLEDLAPRVNEWGPLVPHEQYVAAMRGQHARKTAFWARVVR